MKPTLYSAFFCILFFCAPTISHAEDFTLKKLIETVKKDYGTISHLPTNRLVTMLGKPDSPVILFDVREQSEYNISHIPGAVFVKPSIWSSTFLRQFGKKVKGKDVVFYCSVGVRSSRLATRVREQLMKLGAKNVYNLSGGIFQWHGDQFNLENKQGSTDFVHPYNSYWGQLVTRKHLLRTDLDK